MEYPSNIVDWRHKNVKENGLSFYREKGIGKNILKLLQSKFSLRHIIAETDDDAIGFYKSCGFDIENLGELYPNTIRYRCTKIYII